MELQISDFAPSDGIRECEAIIKSLGGQIEKGTIVMPISTIILTSPILNAAIDYLVGEWDYAII